MQCISNRLLSEHSVPLRRGSTNSRLGLSSNSLACNQKEIMSGYEGEKCAAPLTIKSRPINLKDPRYNGYSMINLIDHIVNKII